MLTRSLVIALAALAFAPAAASAQLDHRPVRFWEFSETRKGQGEFPVEDGSQQGGRVAESHVFGNAVFDYLRRPDGLATGEVNSSPSGRTFDVYAQSPSGGFERGFPIGGASHLDQYQSYEKQTDQASMRFQITQAVMSAIDVNGNFLPSECPPRLSCLTDRAKVRFFVRAYAESAGGDFFRVGGVAFLHGHQGVWDFDAVTLESAKRALWNKTSFFFDRDLDGAGSGSHALVELLDKVNVDIDLSSLRVGELFATHVELDASAVDERGRESTVEAYLRDPRANGLVRTTGLRELGPPAFEEPPIEPLPAAECPLGPDPDSGVLQLSEPSYVASESDVGGPMVLVTRTDGSAGAVSATVTTSAGSAEAGADYTEAGTTVRFEDGDTSPRLVEIPIAGDEEEEQDETFTVSLSGPSCVSLGDRTSAEVTIADDDRPAEQPDSFTVGGTVTGLEGSGLVLSNLGEQVTVDADGPFAFSQRMADRIPYHVSVSEQPSEPDQVCTVANGEGTIAGADVTDVAVECVTPPPVTGLDPGFGAGGKVSTRAGGRGQAVAIQPDGMIVTAGGSGDFAVTRHEPDGDPDPSFGGGDGIVTTNLGATTDEAFDVAIDQDGRIVVAGKSGSDFGVARYEPDGDPDAAFGGGDGIVVTDFNGGFDAASGLALQPDGKIVVAGNAGVVRVPGLGFQNDFAFVRYEADGDVDLKVTTELGSDTDLGNGVALDAQDRIIVAGQVNQGDDFALVRYEPDGDVDTSFAGGIVTTDFGGGEAIKGIAVRPDGRIVVAGYSSTGPTDFDFAVAQYSADGVLDEAFGLVKTDLSHRQFGDDFAEDLALEPDGGIVVVGRNTSDTFNDLAIVRYDADGGLRGDPLLIDFHGTGDVGTDVAVDADGRIVAAGFAPNGFTNEFVLARALP